MNNYQEFFKGKKVTQLGLGLLGRGLNDAIFMLENDVADLILTDKKSAEELASSVVKLKGYENLTLRLGEHRLEDFEDRDFIFKGAGVPLDSEYIAHAKAKGIPIEMDSSLCVKLLPPGVITVGVTGTRGKSTVTHLITHILKTANKKTYIGGNVRDMATLPLLKEIKSGDFLVLELDSWQLQGFGESKISPHIAVFTNLMSDHLNYYKNNPGQYYEDKANIFKFQKEEDFLIVGEGLKTEDTLGQKVVASSKNVPKDWDIKIPGEHNLLNIACAIEAARALGISEADIKTGVESFEGVDGRLKFAREINGIKIYNDNNSTTPEATIAALRAIGNNKNIILIIGGDDKNLNASELIAEIPKYAKKVVLFKERGTDKIRDAVLAMQKDGIEVFEEEGLQATVQKAFSVAGSGDIILYSPAFSSFGKYFKNEYDRNDQFLKIVEGL